MFGLLRCTNNQDLASSLLLFFWEDHILTEDSEHFSDSTFSL